MTSTTTVLNQYQLSSATRSLFCTESELCTISEHLGHTFGVDIAAEDVVRRYLMELMRGRFPTKTALATGMGTSRSQLQASIRDGRLTVDQMNALAEATGSSIFSVLKEMTGLAAQMERGKLPKLTDDEITEMLSGSAKVREEEPILEADVDRMRLSAGRRGRRAESRPASPDAPGGRARQNQPPDEQHQRRQR